MEIDQMMVKLFEKLEEYVLAVLMAAMLFLVIGQIILRFAQIPIFWIQEASTLSFTWIVFVGAALGYKRGSKISVDIIASYFPANLRRAIETGTEALILLFLTVIGVVGIKLLVIQRLFTTPSLEVPEYVFTAALPFSLALMASYTLRSLLRRLKILSGDGDKC